MLKKLRIKLTLITMSLVTLVLVLVFVSLLISTYRTSIDQTKQALEIALQRASGEGGRWEQMFGPRDTEAQQTIPEGDNSQVPVIPPGGEFPEFEIGRNRNDRKNPFEESFLTPTIVVRASTDDSIEVIQTNMATIADENLFEIVDAVKGSAKTEGRLSAYDLRFRVQNADDGAVLIAFAECSQELTQLKNQAVSSLLIGVPALVALFFISLGLSSLALRPVRRSMEQQKQFIADASHELKTPLTVILANNEVLMQHPERSVGSQQQWLQSTKEEGARMRQLIENMLFLAKSDADRLPVSLEPLDLSDLIEETILTFEPVAFEHGNLIDSAIEPNLQMKADHTQMKQLLMILLDNAVKYAAPNSSIRVRAYRGGSSLVLTVNDRGQLIPPEAIPHLFERFYRTDEARARGESGGYGLGLAIAETIANLHHGQISAASNEAEGTTFTVTFPVEKGE